jgi:hypothetical protein
MASMEHPLFSLATQPDMRHLVYRSGDNSLEIIPSGLGLPTIKDKDILIFCISQLMDRKNRGEPIGKRVRFSARELMIGTNRNTDGRDTSASNTHSSACKAPSSRPTSGREQDRNPHLRSDRRRRICHAGRWKMAPRLLRSRPV